MAVIVAASPKGGVGKTTISLFLAEELAVRGYDVAIVEADPAAHNARYRATREEVGRALNFTLYTDRSETTLGRTIKDADGRHDVVIVDLPGQKGLLLTRAVARANLVLIPMMMDNKDANAAIDGLETIAVEVEHLERPIEHRLVLNGVTNAAQGENAVAIDRTERFLRQAVAEADYPRLRSELTFRRGGYRESYTFAQTLRELNAARKSVGMERAQHEVERMTDEVLELLKMPASIRSAAVTSQ